MFHVNRYRMLEVRRAMRRERIFRDRTNPLEIYDDLELIEIFRCNETSVFAVAHILSHFFCISLMSLFTELTFMNSNIQTHPTLNVYPHKVLKVCIIYLLKN
jgi:hypothetical protein